MAHLDLLTEKIIGACIAVHRALGPGLLESAYQVCVAAELRAAGIAYQREVPINIEYRGETLDCAFRLDFLIENTVILEIKAIERVLPVHQAQLLSYLKITGKPTGLLINFHVPVLKDGITRRVL